VSVAINVYRADNVVRYDDKIVKQLIYPEDFLEGKEVALTEARALGEDILNLIEEFDGPINLVVEFRPDPYIEGEAEEVPS